MRRYFLTGCLLLLFISTAGATRVFPADADQVLDTFWGKGKRAASLAPIPCTRALSLPEKGLQPPCNSERGPVVLPGKSGSVSVERAPGYASLFLNSSGWIGGDGNYSVSLGGDTTLWLHGDTFLGEIKGGVRCEGFKIANNTISLQKGYEPATASMKFFSGRDGAGEPCAVVAPEDGKGWFWIYDGVRTGGRLFLFLIQIDRDRGSALGFKSVGMWLGRVENPDEPPEKWKITQKKIPCSLFSADGDTFLGSAVLKREPYIYIYGIKEKHEGPWLQKFMIIARAPGKKLDDFSAWEFFDGTGWSSDFGRIAGLFGDCANEFTVSYEDTLHRFIVIYTENGASENINMRLAPEPEGPWSDPVTVYECPEKEWNRNILLYAAKGHPSLSVSPGELIVSYIANSIDFNDLLKDARLYNPQFLRLRFTTD